MVNVGCSLENSSNDVIQNDKLSVKAFVDLMGTSNNFT